MDFWDVNFESWKALDQVSKNPSSRFQNSFWQLVARLKTPVDFEFRDNCFFKLQLASREVNFYSKALASRVFFSINIHHQNPYQNQLILVEPNCIGALPLSIIVVHKHQGHKAYLQYALHSNDDAPINVGCLVASTWDDNSQLNVVEPHYLKNVSPFFGFQCLHEKLSKWLPRTPIQISNGTRWA